MKPIPETTAVKTTGTENIAFVLPLGVNGLFWNVERMNEYSGISLSILVQGREPILS
jgi:hypothetical protein